MSIFLFHIHFDVIGIAVPLLHCGRLRIANNSSGSLKSCRLYWLVAIDIPVHVLKDRVWLEVTCIMQIIGTDVQQTTSAASAATSLNSGKELR